MQFSEKFIESFIHPRNDLLLKMEQYAEENHVPIMKLSAIEVLCQLLRMQQPNHLLEVGTAIGYSAIRMAEAVPTCQIVTIERDEQRAQMAKQFIEESTVANRIT
ncbi:MAG: SAM-dependent methyltransferase, partial [Lysinibacillus sp.]|nr:SAM-dependent methyltransferase [Lysinibacillus sp.]